MHVDVGRVAELPGQHGVLATVGDLLGLGDGALHALGSRGENELGTVGAHDGAALDGHRVRHDDDGLEAAGRRDHGQGDTGVAGGALDDGAARLEAAGGDRVVDDGRADAILDAVCRVGRLELGDDVRLEALGQGVETDQRGAADGLGDV